MMKCPYCGGKALVNHSNYGEDEVIRERKCVECGTIFYTSETDIDFEQGRKLLFKYDYEQQKNRMFKMNVNN